MEGLLTTLQKMQLDARSWLCWLPTRPFSGDILFAVALWNRDAQHLLLDEIGHQHLFADAMETAVKLVDEFGTINDSFEQWKEKHEDDDDEEDLLIAPRPVRGAD